MFYTKYTYNLIISFVNFSQHYNKLSKEEYMKLKISCIFLIIIVISCQQPSKNSPIPDENTNNAHNINKDRQDPFKYLKLDRNEGPRYKPVQSTAQKIQVKDLADGQKAVVNNTVILQSEIYTYAKNKNIDLNIQPVQRDELLEQLCSDMIYNILVDEAIETKQLIVDENTVQERKQQTLQNSELSLEKFLKKYKISEKEFHKVHTVQIYLDSLINDEMKKNAYEKIKKELKQERQFVLLIQGGRAAKEEDLPILEASTKKLKQRGLAGEDFAELCKKYSHNHMAQKNNAIMSLTQGDNPNISLIYDIVFDLKKEGDFSKVTKLPPEAGIGYFVIQLKKITVPTQEMMDDVLKNRLRQNLEMLFFTKLVKTNMVTRRPKDEVPIEFQAERKKDGP